MEEGYGPTFGNWIYNEGTFDHLLGDPPELSMSKTSTRDHKSH